MVLGWEEINTGWGGDVASQVGQPLIWLVATNRIVFGEIEWRLR